MDKINPFDMGYEANAKQVWCHPEDLLASGEPAEPYYLNSLAFEMLPPSVFIARAAEVYSFAV